MLLFGPLAQFELLEKNPTCHYDLFFGLFGISEFHDTLFWLTFILLGWQIYEFYHEESLHKQTIDFDSEVIIIDLVTSKNANYADLVTLFFSLIFSCNFAGLIPYTQTISSQIIFTLMLSSLTMLIIWLHAFATNKILMFNHFLPQGSPLIITPFIIIIELISNFSRIISLAVRLFANMTSGHALLKILASFGLGAISLLLIWKGLIALAFLIVFIISLLELLIAFLQTYVFVTLLLIYISEQE
jgi:F-type H+-transporting ATPase subunit a